MLKNVLFRDDRHEFQPILAEIEDEPTSPLGRIIFWLVVLVVLFFAIWMCVGEIDVVASGQGKVQPDDAAVRGVQTIQPLETGVVHRIFVHEGEEVKTGQILMEIDPSTTKPELESDRKNLNYGHLEIARIQATLADRPFTATSSDLPQEALETQQRMHDAALNSLHAQVDGKRQEIAKLDQQLQTARADEASNRSLLAVSEEKERKLKPVLDIIARDDYEKVTNDILTYRNKIDDLRYHATELNHQKSQLDEEIRNIQQDFRKTLLQDLGDKQKQVTELQAKVDEIRFKNTEQRIVAPVNGYIDNLAIHTVGGVVTPAQKLMTIVPKNTQLIVKATMLNRDVGFIRAGMPVSLKIDAFDFQKYGLLQGKVRHVSNNSRDDQKLGAVFEVEITPLNRSLLVDGQRKYIEPGMSVRAEVKVGKRRIIEFFIYPLIKYLNEGISVR